MKHIYTGIFLFAALSLVSVSCGVSLPGSGRAEAPDTFTAAVWNLQALFDGEEKGNEYGEYRESAGWTAEKYRARLTAISQAVPQMANFPIGADGGSKKTAAPDLLGLVEVENAGILKDLANGSLSQHGYQWTAFAALPGSSLGVGFLSRFPLTDVRSHSITTGKDTAPRPVLEVRVEPGVKPGETSGAKPLVFLLCHWKSKLGGDKATEALRCASARVVQRRLRELRESEAETPVIIMGDLNENHDEFYRLPGKGKAVFYTALLPDDPEAAALAFETTKNPDEKDSQGTSVSGVLPDFLVLSTEKPPRAEHFPDDVAALYSPWYEELSGGSYLYREEWESIDHLLLSEGLFDGSGWEFAGCRVLNQAPFIKPDGAPESYIPKSGRGLSDHLPLLLHLQDLPVD